MNNYLSIKIACLILMLCSGFTISSCKKGTVRGEGPIVTENRTLLVQQGYYAVKVKGSADVYIRYGEESKLEIKGYQNLLNVYDSDVSNGGLELGYRNDYNVRNDNIKVYITIPFAPDISSNGSSRIIYSGDFPFQEDLEATINGSGSISFSNVEVEEVYFSINGSGEIKAENIVADEASIHISGSGDVRLSVNDRLNVNISGSGNVYYKGRPVINQQISGSGKIISLE